MFCFSNSYLNLIGPKSNSKLGLHASMHFLKFQQDWFIQTKVIDWENVILSYSDFDIDPTGPKSNNKPGLNAIMIYPKFHQVSLFNLKLLTLY